MIIKKDTDTSDPVTGTSQGSLDFTRTLTEVRRALMRFTARYFKSEHDIEDVVQEAFVKVLAAGRKKHIQSPKAYLYRTVRNLSLNKLNTCEYRLTDTLGDLLDETVLLESISLEEQFESTRKFELFCEAVRQLPNKCQKVFVMRRVYGFTQLEIADELGISIKTVESHLTKALLYCNQYMKDKDSQEQAGISSGGVKKVDE